MFLGHFAVAFAAKRAVPSVSLGAWCAAAQFLDLLWPAFLLAGWERVAVDPGNTRVTPLDFLHYPWSHSLLMAALWGAAFAGGHFALRRDARAALLLGAVVLSHWGLDVLFHRPDLPLFPGGPLAGLGLWNHVWVTLAAELGLFALGVFLYESSTRATAKAGSRGLGLFVIILLVTYAGNVFGPPPPEPLAVAYAGLAMWLLIAWAWWFDRNRAPATGALTPGRGPSA